MGLKYLALLLLIPQIVLGYTPGQSVISVGDNKRGNRSQQYVPPPASGLTPTAQYTYAADHEPTTDLWRMSSFDYYVSPTGNSGAAGTFADPFDFQEVCDGTVSITLNTGDYTSIGMRGGTYIYPNRGNGHGGFEYDLKGQTPAADWSKSTSYSVGDQVREDNQNPDSGHRDLSTLESFSPHFWECTTAHTSGTGTLQDDVANWKYVHIPDHYILFRNYNGETVYIDGGLEAVGLDIDSGPQYIAFWGLNHYSQEFVDDWDSDGNDDTSVNAAGDRFLAYEGNASFPSNIPHDGSVSTTYGRGFRMINNVSWAINFGSGGTQAEEQWWHGNISYDSGWVTTERYHGPYYYQRNGEVTNTIASATGDPKEMWLDTNMMLESYSQQLQIYGTSGVPLEMFVIQRNFAMKHPNSGRENFLGGGNRNFGQWNYPVTWRENVTYDCDQTIGIITGGDWLEFHDNTVFSKTGEQDRQFDYASFGAGSTQYNAGSESNNLDDPTGVFVYLAENSFEYGRGNLMIVQTGTPTDNILVDIGELFTVDGVERSGDQYAVYKARVHDPLAQTPIATGTHSIGTDIAINTNSEEAEFFVIVTTALAP